MENAARLDRFATTYQSVHPLDDEFFIFVYTIMNLIDSDSGKYTKRRRKLRSNPQKTSCKSHADKSVQIQFDRDQRNREYPADEAAGSKKKPSTPRSRIRNRELGKATATIIRLQYTVVRQKPLNALRTIHKYVLVRF